jgi:hypothetical protein
MTQAIVALPVQAPGPADAFVDAIGINVHLGYADTGYGTAWGAVRSLLIASGIRHLRDGLIGMTPTAYGRLNVLGAAGIRADLLTGVGQSASEVLAYPSLIPTMESFEGPNEYDLSGDPSWVSDLIAFQRMLYGAVTGSAATAGYPVIGPSLTSEQAFLAVGDIAGSQTYGNLHVYFAGRNPGTAGWGATDAFGTYGSLAYNAALGRSVSGSEPLIVTETGYDDSPSDSGYVSAAIKVRYTLRTLFTFWNSGIRRTYLYEFLDEGGARYGLVTAAGSPKPVYAAVKACIAALSDPGAAFTPQPAAYGVSGVSTIRQTLLQKRDGSYVLALWNEVPSWDPTTHGVVAVAPRPVTLSFAVPPGGISAATFSDAGSLIASVVTAVSSCVYTLVIDDRVTLVTFAPSR